MTDAWVFSFYRWMTPFIIAIPCSKEAITFSIPLWRPAFHRKQACGWHQGNIKLPISYSLLYYRSSNWTSCSAGPLAGGCVGLKSDSRGQLLIPCPAGSPCRDPPPPELLICKPRVGSIPSLVHCCMANREHEELPSFPDRGKKEHCRAKSKLSGVPGGSCSR